jgi:hypothetical protein
MPVGSWDSGQLDAWVASLDAVIAELEDDLVRRAIVHLQTLREALRSAAGHSSEGAAVG